MSANSPNYIRDEDIQEYRNFTQEHIRSFARDPVTEVWHYTNADGLIGILQSGKIWVTQISCLNDSFEQRYFSTLVHAKLKSHAAENKDPDLGIMFRVADKALSDADFATAGHFVACFSEVEDDLGQWRGYGGGESGYAIGLRFDGILQALKARPNALLLPMSYEEVRHAALVSDVIQMAENYFLEGVDRAKPNIEQWAEAFLEAFARELDIFASIIKHPKFVSERERRITTSLQTGEHMQLEFRQKRTLLARHLPIPLTAGSDKPLRPITRIYVGPGAGQRVSQVSISELLVKSGYENVCVELSRVPYRVP